MLISLRKRFIFLANSKTGSTTIEAALKPHADFVWTGSPRVKHAKWREVQTAFSELFSREGYAPGNFMRFGVIREPADWVLSWYNYRRFTKNGGIPESLSLEEFWRRDDWVKRRSQSSHFLDQDGACRFDLVIPLDELRTALPRLLLAMGVESGTVEERNRSQGSLKREMVSLELWAEINEHYRTDWRMYREWEQRFGTEFERVLDEHYGAGFVPLQPLPEPIEVTPPQGEPKRKPRAAPRLRKTPSAHVALLRIVPPREAGDQQPVDSFDLKGVVLLKPDVNVNGCELLVADSRGERPVDWGLPSPRISDKFPDHPLAARCRFRAPGVVVHGATPVVLWLRLPGGERHQLVTMRF